MADITKANEKIAAWEKNLEKLKNGKFGAETSPEALVKYWRAQADEGYSGADDNVRYWTEVTGMARVLMDKCDEELDCSKKADCDICRASNLYDKGYRKGSDVALEVIAEIEEGIKAAVSALAFENNPVHRMVKRETYSSLMRFIKSIEERYTEEHDEP